MEPILTLLLGFFVGGIFLMFNSISEWFGKWGGGKCPQGVVRFVLGMVIAGATICVISHLPG